MTSKPQAVNVCGFGLTLQSIDILQRLKENRLDKYDSRDFWRLENNEFFTPTAFLLEMSEISDNNNSAFVYNLRFF